MGKVKAWGISIRKIFIQLFLAGMLFFLPFILFSHAEQKNKFPGMVLVPAGEFMMGSGQGLSDEKPPHKVFLDAYFMDAYEITNARFKKCVDAGACKKPFVVKYYEKPEYAAHPVVYVDWFMADAYCKWRGGRLPTEAEWEKAARGNEKSKFPWGDMWCENCANWYESGKKDGYSMTAPVGSFKKDKSSYGVYDMTGNVSEWVSDWYDENYYKVSPYKNPEGPETCKYKTARGGSWWDALVKDGRGTHRISNVPSAAMIDLGFRCAVAAMPRG